MSSIGDIIISSLQELLHQLFSPITNVIQQYAPSILDAVVSTPHPDTIFSAPTNAGWPQIYAYYWDSLIPLALFLWAVSIGLVIFLESTSHLFSSYNNAKLKRRALAGLLGILSWWWIAALSLQFVNALTGLLIPDLSSISLFQTLSFGTMGVLGLVFSLSIDLILFVLIGLLYFTRQVVLYLFVLMMPLLIVFWIPGVGPFVLVSRFMRRLAGFFVPFLFMTVPVAILFRLGALLGASFELSMSGIGAWLVALIIPLVAVVSPFVLFWQAGALFLATDRAAYHTSPGRARTRVTNVRETHATATLVGQDFSRGARGLPLKRDGQYLLTSGDSRAHALGTRLNAGGSRLRQSLRPRRDVQSEPSSPSKGQRSSTRFEPSRADTRSVDFPMLRSRRPTPRRRSPSPDRRSSRDDDQPPYYY